METNNNNQNQNGVLYTPPVNNNQPAQPAAYTPYVPTPKVYDPMTKKDAVFALLSLLTAFIMVDFAFFKSFNLGFTIAYALLFAVTTAYLWKRTVKKTVFPLICGALSLAGAVTFTLFDNTIVNAIMVFLVFGLYVIYALGVSGTFTKSQGNFKLLIDMAMSLFGSITGLSEVIGSAKAGSKKNKNIIQALIGFAIAVPFLCVIIPLLSSSDAAFEGLVTKLIENIGVYLTEMVIAIIIVPFLFSFLFARTKQPEKSGGKKNAHRVLSNPLSVTFLAMISVTYVVYLFSQLAYFFSAFKGILPEDYHYTASAFARRGFYEMFAICAINVAIISLVSILTKRAKGKLSPAIKILSLFISLFSVLLVVVAMQKMRLNISIYGLSNNRVLVCTLMVMLLIIIAFFILHIFAPKVSYMQPIIVICSAMFMALSFANIDALCADYNIKAYQSGRIETLDTVNIRKSSDSAIPYLIELAKSDDEVISNSAKTQLAIYINNNGYLELERKLDKYIGIKIDSDVFDFRYYNKARNDAYTMLRDYYASLDEKGKKPINELDRMYREFSYDDWDDKFIDSSHEDYELYYSYNPKTGLYDKVKKQTW